MGRCGAASVYVLLFMLLLSKNDPLASYVYMICRWAGVHMFMYNLLCLLEDIYMNTYDVSMGCVEVGRSKVV